MSKPKKNDGTFPSMWYHPKTGAYVVCNTPNDVPEGFVNSPHEVKGYDPHTTVELPRYEGHTPTPIADDDDEDDDDEDDNTPPKAATLEDLKISREEAIKLLEEEGLNVKKNISNAKLAEQVQELLEEEDEGDEEGDE